MTTDRTDSPFIPLNRERLRNDLMYRERPTELLLDCLRAGAEGEKNARPGRLSEPDWSDLFDVAVRHRVAPLLYDRLKPLASSCNVPPGVLQKLHDVSVANAARNMRITPELGKMLAALQQAGIPIIVLKGIYLAEAVYTNIALRWMCDADLLVPRAELPKAQAILLDMGYGPREREDIGLLCQRNKHLDQFAGENSRVELHWGIANPTSPFEIDIAGLWERAQPVNIANVQVLALSPEDLLLHICLHASHQHGLVWGLRPFCDIAQATRHFGSELDWRQFVERAREWGASRYASLTLHLARNLLGAPVPEDVLGQLVPEGLGPEVFEVARETVITGTHYDKWLSPAYLGLRDRKPLAHKLKLLWERVFLSRDAMLAEYPASRDSRHPYVYHVRRIRDIMRKWRPALRMMLNHEWERSLSRNASLDDWLRSGK